MKKYLLLLIPILPIHNANSQVLYNETFDNYTLGDLGTDPNGVIPGQDGWLTEGKTATSKNNSFFSITSEVNKGKVLTLSSATPPQNEILYATKNGLNTLIDQRTPGNNVIKFEIDYFTGSQHTFLNGSNGIGNDIMIGNDVNFNNKSLVWFGFRTSNGAIATEYFDGITPRSIRLNNNNNVTPTLPFNSWIKFNVYLDYNNKKIYFETPYFNTVAVADYLSKSSSSNLMQDFKISKLGVTISTTDVTSTHQMVNKYDNIKITALQSVPPSVLSASSFLSESFNLYPNPATNLVNITNSDNMFVNQVQVYDLSGKLINTQTFNNEAEIKLNVETLTSGSYLLHLQTDKGIAVKKLIKK